MKNKNTEAEIHCSTKTDAFPLFLILPMLMFTHIQGVQAEKKAQAVEAKAIEYGIIGKGLSEFQIDDGGNFIREATLKNELLREPAAMVM